MDGSLGWLADGSMNPIPPQYRDWEKNDYEHPARDLACLLYTSDAADERSSVDLGGRRIIKNKNDVTRCRGRLT